MSNSEYLIGSAVDMVREAKTFKQFSQIPKHHEIARQLNVSLNIVWEMAVHTVFMLNQWDDGPKDSDEDWFGIVRWCDEDIKHSLEEYGYQDCPENVAMIRNKCEHHRFTDGMIETGWDYINAYVEECAEDLIEVKKNEEM